MLAFFGALRVGELVSPSKLVVGGLDISYVSIQGDAVTLLICKLKTDLLGKGTPGLFVSFVQNWGGNRSITVGFERSNLTAFWALGISSVQVVRSPVTSCRGGEARPIWCVLRGCVCNVGCLSGVYANRECVW